MAGCRQFSRQEKIKVWPSRFSRRPLTGNRDLKQDSRGTEFSLAPNGASLRIYTGDATSAPATFYRVDNANVAASNLFDGVGNVGWIKLSNSTKGTPGFASFNFCDGQCTYDMPVYSPPGAPNIVYIGSAMQYGEIGGPSNGRAIQRSEDAGVNFTDMTIDTQGISLHPDQHAIAATPFNPNVVFIANDGGMFRLNGSFANVSTNCSSRGLSGNDLVDCTSWLSKVPTTISSLNRGLGTLQYQSLSVNVQDPLNDIMGGTQDNGTHAFTSKSNGNGKGNTNWFVTIFGDGGQSGISSFEPNIRFHTFYDAQIDMNFQSANPLGWNWVSDTFFGSGAAAGEGRSFYLPIIYDPAVAGTIWQSARCVGHPPLSKQTRGPSDLTLLGAQTSRLRVQWRRFTAAHNPVFGPTLLPRCRISHEEVFHEETASPAGVCAFVPLCAECFRWEVGL